MIYVLGGTYEQAKRYADLYIPIKVDYRIVNASHELRGLSQPTCLIVGSFWERKDAVDFITMLKLASYRLELPPIDEFDQDIPPIKDVA